MGARAHKSIDHLRVYRIWRELVAGGEDEPVGGICKRFGISERMAAAIPVGQGRPKASKPGNLTRKVMS